MNFSAHPTRLELFGGRIRFALPGAVDGPFTATPLLAVAAFSHCAHGQHPKHNHPYSEVTK